MAEAWTRSVSTGEPYDIEHRIRLADGAHRWMRSRASARRDEAGRIVRWYGTTEDIEERKQAEIERERPLAEVKDAAHRQRRFLREMLLGFTDGRLHLCDTEADLPTALPLLADVVELSAPALRLLRKQVQQVAERLKFPEERWQDLETAAHEAAMNAVRYGRGGAARICGDTQAGRMQVWIRDQGDGIAEDMIHRAVEQGFTTGGFGQGFFLMRSCADRLYLLTGAGGTTVVLEQECELPPPAWLHAVNSLT